MIVARSDATPAMVIVAVASFCPVPPPAILAAGLARRKLGQAVEEWVGLSDYRPKVSRHGVAPLQRAKGRLIRGIRTPVTTPRHVGVETFHTIQRLGTRLMRQLCVAVRSPGCDPLMADSSTVLQGSRSLKISPLSPLTRRPRGKLQSKR